MSHRRNPLGAVIAILVKGVQGLPDQPIVIQGAPVSEDGKRATIIDGGRSLDPMRASTKPGSPCKPAKGKPTSASRRARHPVGGSRRRPSPARDCLGVAGSLRHGDVLVEGPEFIYRGDEQPRVMKTAWRTSDGAVQLEIAFSTPIQDPPSDTHVALRLEAGGTVGSEPCRKVRTTALDCRFPGLTAMPPMTATLLLPRSIRSPGGKPVTLWAATVSNVEFQP